MVETNVPPGFIAATGVQRITDPQPADGQIGFKSS
jgi:hypothetical protein